MILNNINLIYHEIQTNKLSIDVQGKTLQISFMISIEISRKNLIVILGSTATGKTRLAIQLADELGGEIISADSRQVYRGMDIGTGKDLEEYELNGHSIPYHLIDIADPMEEYNVAQFQKDFYRVSSEIKGRKKLPILCGGTGFYIKAVLMPFEFPVVGPNKNLRHKLENWMLEDLIQELENISPGASENTPVDTKRRVIRAIEVEKDRGEGKRVRNKLKSKVQIPLVLGVEYPREVIRERITKRLHERLENGMIEEVEMLLQNGVTHERLCSLGLEYRFISQYIQGEITREKMTTQLDTAIHRFAKKQMTFFRNIEKNGIKINWIPEGNFSLAINLIKG